MGFRDTGCYKSQLPHTGTHHTLLLVTSRQSISGSTRAFFPFRSLFHPQCKLYNTTSVKCCWCDSLLGMETKLASLLFAWIKTGELLQVKSRSVFCLYCLYLCLFSISCQLIYIRRVHNYNPHRNPFISRYV
jgi:hypothetical protein